MTLSVVTMVLGWIAGAVWIALGWRRSAAALPPAAADLQADRAVDLADQIGALRDLEHGRERLQPEHYAAERQRLEAAAAAIMEAVPAPEPATATRAESAPAAAAVGGRRRGSRRAPAGRSASMRFFAAYPQLSGGLWGGGIVAVVGGLLLWVQAAGTPDPAAAPTAVAGPRTAGALAASSVPPAGLTPEARAQLPGLQARLATHPDDAVALAQLAHILLRAQMLDEAGTVNDRLLILVPTHQEGLVHQAVLRAAAGEGDAGLQQLAEILEGAPELAEAWFFQGMLAMQINDMVLMRRSFERFAAVAPAGPQRDRVVDMLKNL